MRLAFWSPMMGLAILSGTGILVLLCVNAIAFRTKTPEGLINHRLLNTAWGLSVLSLLVPYIAPFSLTMAVVALRRPALDVLEAAALRRPTKMAIVNSVWALLTMIAVLAIVLGRSHPMGHSK
jgi:hypothetical protein